MLFFIGKARVELFHFGEEFSKLDCDLYFTKRSLPFMSVESGASYEYEITSVTGIDGLSITHEFL